MKQLFFSISDVQAMESSSFDEEDGGPVVELVDLDILKSKLQFGLSERIKYSCIDVSQSWLVCGTAAGSLHVFERGVFKLQRIVPLKEGAVRQIAISEEGAETWIAYGCESRVVGVILLDRRREEIDANWPTLTVDSAPTCLVWSSSLDPGSPPPTSVSSSFTYSSSAARSLFVGDAGGRVTQCFVSSSRHVNFFRDNAVKLASFDAAVVQLDEPGTGGRFLLVSTSRRTYVIDVVRGLYVGVGKKARDAPLGACFVPSSEDSVFHIFAVRPGRRLWEAEMDGRVVRTVQLPSTALDPSRIVARLGSGGAAAVRLGTEEPFLAKVLLEPRSRLLVAHSAHFLHFVRPEDGALVASAVTTVGARIVDVRVAYGSVFVQYRPDEASGSAVVAQLDVRVAGSATSCYPDGDEEEEEFPAVEAEAETEAPLLEDRRPRDGDADFEDGWNRAGTDGWDSDDPDDGYEHGWPVDASMMAVGLYSAEIFQFNDLLFAELSTKMRDRFGRWLSGNEDGGSGRPVKPSPSSSSSKLNDVPGSPVVVVGTKMATDVKTLVKELGEKAKIVTSLLDDRATTAEERRRLGDNWVRYLEGFPDAVLAATRFRFPASAWAAIVPRDVREANADVVLRVVCRARSSSRRLKDGVDCPEFDDYLCNGNNYDASSDAEADETLSCLVESSEEEKGWISSLSKVWFLIDGETVLEELTSSTVEARPLREKFLLWSIALCILGATSDSSSDLSDERVSSFPKRAWLPRVRAAVDAGLVDAARLGDLCSRVEDPAKPVELLFLLAAAARRAGGKDGGAFRSSLATAFEDFWRATRGREACRSALAEASRVGAVARAALEEVYEDPAARTTLVEIGKTAGWLDEGAVVKLLTRCVEECRGGGGGPSSSRGERLAEVSLRVLGGGKTSELLETLSGSHAFSRRFLTKFMLCCYAEGKYGLDGRTAAECVSTLGADDDDDVRHPPRPMTVPPPSSSSSSTVPDRSQRPFYHWSAEVDVSRGCCSCGISLRNGNMLFPDAASGMESGMVAFRCGHVYHAACLPHPGRGADGKTGKICVLCVRWRS